MVLSSTHYFIMTIIIDLYFMQNRLTIIHDHAHYIHRLHGALSWQLAGSIGASGDSCAASVPDVHTPLHTYFADIPSALMSFGVIIRLFLSKI